MRIIAYPGGGLLKLFAGAKPTSEINWTFGMKRVDNTFDLIPRS